MRLFVEDFRSQFLYKKPLHLLTTISQLQALPTDRNKMSRYLLLLAVCVVLGNCLPLKEKREAQRQNCAGGQCNQNNGFGGFGGGFGGFNVFNGGGFGGVGGATQNCAYAQCNQNNGRKKRAALIIGSPEWQAYKNAELAHIAPSIGPLAYVGRNFAQEQLNWQQQQLIHQQNALNFVTNGAGRHKRQVQIQGSPEWQAYKNAELAFIAPSIGPLASAGRNFAQEQLNFVAPSPGPTPVNYAQSALNFVAQK